MSIKFLGLTDEQWALLLAKVPENIIITKDALGILSYCRKHHISIPCEKIEHIIAEDNRPRNWEAAWNLCERYMY